MAKCHAMNLSNRKPCKRTDTIHYTTSDGVVREVCTKHVEQIKQGKNLIFHTEGQAQSTVAVIETPTETTHISLKDGAEITQERLPLEEEKTMDANESRVMRIIEKGEAGVFHVEDDFFVVAGTGSRSLQTASRETKLQAQAIVETEVKRLKEKYGDKLVIMSGMAEGFDKLLALTALKYEVKLWCAIPNHGYANYYWARNSLTGQDMMEEFKAIIAKAWTVTFVCGNQVYVNGRHSNFVRNDYMVEKADAFLVWDPSTSGTAQCFKSIKAAKKPYKVLTK